MKDLKYEHQSTNMNTKFWGGVGYYNFPRSTNKIKSFDKILTSEKIIFFCIFLLWGRVKLNFRDRYGKPNIYSKNSSCYQVFSSNSQKLSLWCKNKSLSMQMDLYDPYKSPHSISWGNYNFPRSTNKIQFLMKFPHLEKNCWI